MATAADTKPTGLISSVFHLLNPFSSSSAVKALDASTAAKAKDEPPKPCTCSLECRLLTHRPEYPSPHWVKKHGKFVRDGGELDSTLWRIEWEGRKMIVKGGRDVEPVEAEWMKLVREKTKLPVPEIYHVRRWGQETYIYQEFVAGKFTFSLWQGNSQWAHHTTREALEMPHARFAAQVQDVIEQISAIEAPKGACIGGTGFRGRHLDVFSDRWSGSKTPPAFTSAEDFHKWLKAEYLAHPEHSAEVWEKEVEPLLIHDPAAPLILVHGDLGRFLLADEEGNITGIIDWELAGWYPQWMKTYQAWELSRWSGGPVQKAIGTAMVGSSEEQEKYKGFKHVQAAVSLVE